MLFSLFPPWTIVSALGIYHESLVFGVHFAPMGCNFQQFFTWCLGKFGHLWADLVIITGTVHHVVPWGWRCCLELNGLVLCNEDWVPTNVPNNFKWKHHVLCLWAPHSLIYLFFHSFVKNRLFLSLLYDTFFFLGHKRDVTVMWVSLTALHSK